MWFGENLTVFFFFDQNVGTIVSNRGVPLAKFLVAAARLASKSQSREGKVSRAAGEDEFDSYEQQEQGIVFNPAFV